MRRETDVRSVNCALRSPVDEKVLTASPFLRTLPALSVVWTPV